jgi:rhamnose utilization protein RhaD (predicted bifunctional aldolase and dehydrogenase)
MKENPGAVRELVERSNLLGSDPRNTNYARPNTSAKASVPVPVPVPVTAKQFELMWLKGSGGDVANLTSGRARRLEPGSVTRARRRLPRGSAGGRDDRRL